MGTSREREDRDDELALPLYRGGASWRFGLAGALVALMGVQAIQGAHVDASRGEWEPILWALLVPEVIALTLSAIGIRREWSPPLLFRLLPALVLVGLFLVVVALDM